MRTFMIIWFGQIISLIGTGLTGLALGVYVYELTGSTTQFALIGLFSGAFAPGIAVELAVSVALHQIVVQLLGDKRLNGTFEGQLRLAPRKRYTHP